MTVIVYEYGTMVWREKRHRSLCVLIYHGRRYHLEEHYHIIGISYHDRHMIGIGAAGRGLFKAPAREKETRSDEDRGTTNATSAPCQRNLVTSVCFPHESCAVLPERGLVMVTIECIP